MLDLKSVPVPNEDFCVREVGDETVFLAETGREVLSLNPIGSFIWKQFDGVHSLQDVLDIICNEYEVEPDLAEADLRTFIAQLEENKLLTLQTADA